jgi:hypothetical protein
MKPHVNHEDAVTVPKTHPLVLLVLAGAQSSTIRFSRTVLVVWLKRS